MTDAQEHKTGTFLKPIEQIPTFTHDLMGMEADKTKHQFLAITEDVTEHIDEYMKYNPLEKLDTKMRAFSIIDTMGQQSTLGIALDVYLNNKTFQYIIKIPPDAVEFIQGKDYIAIISKEKEILGLVDLNLNVRTQLTADGLSILNLNSYKQGKLRIVLNRETVSPNFLKDYDEYTKTKGVSAEKKDMMATQLYAKYGVEYKITERGKTRGKKLETKYYSGERFTEDELKDAYGLVILMTALEAKPHFSELTDELDKEMKKRFNVEILDMNLNDYLLARGYLELNPDFVPEYELFVKALIDKRKLK